MPWFYTVHAAALMPTELKIPVFLKRFYPEKQSIKMPFQPEFQPQIKGKLQAYNRYNLNQNNTKFTHITYAQNILKTQSLTL